MKGDKNILNYFKTRKYLKNNQNEKYYPYCGLETYVGAQGKRKNTDSNKANFGAKKRISRSNIYK